MNSPNEYRLFLMSNIEVWSYIALLNKFTECGIAVTKLIPLSIALATKHG